MVAGCTKPPPLIAEQLRMLEDFQTLMDQRITDLEKSPLMGKTIPGTPYKQLVIHQHISLFYRVYKNHLLLLAIWDVRQNPSRLTDNLQKHNP